MSLKETLKNPSYQTTLIFAATLGTLVLFPPKHSSHPTPELDVSLTDSLEQHSEHIPAELPSTDYADYLCSELAYTDKAVSFNEISVFSGGGYTLTVRDPHQGGFAYHDRGNDFVPKVFVDINNHYSRTTLDFTPNSSLQISQEAQNHLATYVQVLSEIYEQKMLHGSTICDRE